MKERHPLILKDLDGARVSEAQKIEIDRYRAMWHQATLCISEREPPALLSAFYQALGIIGVDAKRITVMVKMYVAYEPKGQHQHSITTGEIELHGHLLTRKSHADIYNTRHAEMEDKSFYERDNASITWGYIRKEMADASYTQSFPEPTDPAAASMFTQQMLAERTIDASSARAPRRI